MQKPACRTCYKYLGLEGYGPFILRGECEDTREEKKPLDFCENHPKWETWQYIQNRIESVSKLPRLKRYYDGLRGKVITFAANRRGSALAAGHRTKVVGGHDEYVRTEAYCKHLKISDFVLEDCNES